MSNSRRLRGYRAKYQGNPGSTSSTPRLPRSTPRWVDQKVCLPHVFHSLSQPLKTHTIEQEGKLQYPGHHVWRHKRELYIIVHIPWMILTKSPLEDQFLLTLPLPFSWNKQLYDHPRTPWPFLFICRVFLHILMLIRTGGEKLFCCCY